jgi:maltose O-acetyltransferase
MLKIIMKVIHYFKIRKFRKIATIGSFFALSGWKSMIVNPSKIKDRIKIGDHSVVGGIVAISMNGRIEIGSFTYLNINTIISAAELVKIGNYVGIAQNVHIFDNNTHPVEPEARKQHRIRAAPGGEGYPTPTSAWDVAEKKTIRIEDNVWIGMNSYVGKGVTIGEGAVVARNSVVTKDVPPYCIVAGNPAKIVKYFNRAV